MQLIMLPPIGLIVFSAGEYASVSAAWNTSLFAAVRQNKQYLYKFSGITSNDPDWT